MPGLYEITFLPEGRVQRFAGCRGNSYEFDDGYRLDMRTRPVWCRQCGGVRHGEDMESLEEVDAALAKLRQPRTDPLLVTAPLVGPMRFDSEAEAAKFHQKLLDEAWRRQAWRRARRSPAKCTHCGSTDITDLPPGRAVPHPASAGTITLRCVGMCSTAFNEWSFTPEGDRIPRDTKPAYWHHPAMDPALQRRRGGRP